MGRALKRGGPGASQRVRADDFPAVAVEKPFVFLVAGRSVLRQRLDQASGGGRGVEQQHAAGLTAGVLPGMRDAQTED